MEHCVYVTFSFIELSKSSQAAGVRDILSGGMKGILTRRINYTIL